MTEIKWRFPASGYGDKKGISSGDSETFKKHPYQSFAREILQNSIDVRVDDSNPVEIVFKNFTIKTKDIPGIEDYKKAMQRCIKFWKHKADYVKEYKQRLELLNNEEIECLRISDFNTEGLKGIDSTNPEKNFYLALVKGTGVSEKGGSTSGGSKGLGKNASFILSKFGLVYYSTKTNNTGAIGTIGIADLISGYVDDDENTENKDYTQGKGFYSLDDKNNPINDILTIDSSYSGRKENSGTDIYIIGFKKTDNWEKEIINGILDSFMVAIVREELVVEFDEIIIDKKNVKDIVESDIIFEKNKNNIISQYLLSSGGEDVVVRDVETDYGNAQLFMKAFKQDEDDYSTHKCAMIRYPLMKIKDFDYSSSYKISALCIINKGNLGEKLREIENAQHIDWEFSRIDDSSERREVRNVVSNMKQQINDYIQELLQLDMTDNTDVEGAGEFLPSFDDGNNKSAGKGEKDSTDTVTISKIRENITLEKNPTKEDENGSGLVPEIGQVTELGDDVEYPSGENTGQGNGPHAGSEQGGQKTGDNVIFVRQRLAGVKYKVISTDKEKGRIRIIFISPVDSSSCSLNISLIDDSNNRSKVEILSMSANGAVIDCDNPFDYGEFAIKRNEKVVLDVVTNQKEYFACEVKVYANKE